MASPYSTPNKEGQDEACLVAVRFLDVVKAMGYLMNSYKDLSFYSPISHTHPILTENSLPRDFTFWQRFDETMLSRCDELWVLCLDGVEESKGVNSELDIAERFNLPIRYVYPQISDGTYIVAHFGFRNEVGVR